MNRFGHFVKPVRTSSNRSLTVTGNCSYARICWIRSRLFIAKYYIHTYMLRNDHYVIVMRITYRYTWFIQLLALFMVFDNLTTSHWPEWLWVFFFAIKLPSNDHLVIMQLYFWNSGTSSLASLCYVSYSVKYYVIQLHNTFIFPHAKMFRCSISVYIYLVLS